MVEFSYMMTYLWYHTPNRSFNYSFFVFLFSLKNILIAILVEKMTLNEAELRKNIYLAQAFHQLPVYRES